MVRQVCPPRYLKNNEGVRCQAVIEVRHGLCDLGAGGRRKKRGKKGAQALTALGRMIVRNRLGLAVEVIRGTGVRG